MLNNLNNKNLLYLHFNLNCCEIVYLFFNNNNIITITRQNL